MNLLLLFSILTILNTVIQTIKSLCTVRCSTFVSACVNAVAFGLYTFVIFFNASDGINLWAKAGITAAANFFGVYIANFLFKKLFEKTTRWKVEVSIPKASWTSFETMLDTRKLEYFKCGWADDWLAYAVFCKDKNDSKILKEILPTEAKYNVVECIRRL